MTEVAAVVLLKRHRRALACWRATWHPKGCPFEWLGGKREAEDPSLTATAAREVLQETGIVVSPSKLIPFGKVYRFRVDRKTYLIHHFLAPVDSYTGLPELNREIHRGFWWFTYDQVQALTGMFLPSDQSVMADLPHF